MFCHSNSLKWDVCIAGADIRPSYINLCKNACGVAEGFLLAVFFVCTVCFAVEIVFKESFKASVLWGHDFH